MEEKKNNGNGYAIAFAIILGIIILIPSVISFINTKKELDIGRLESKLLKEGKVVSAKTVADSFAKELQNNNYNDLESYLSKDCKLIDSSNNERANLKYCLEKLNKIESYVIERRGNRIKDEETYRIMCNGTNYENTNQIVTLYMRKKVKKEEITYEIYMVKFTDNTPS